MEGCYTRWIEEGGALNILWTKSGWGVTVITHAGLEVKWRGSITGIHVFTCTWNDFLSHY